MRWIIGDVHGMLKPLVTLVTEVRRIDPAAALLFAGDYVNRGPDAKGVIDFLLSLGDARFVRGNHDDIFDLVINGRCYADNAAREDRVAAFQWFMKYGLDQTLLSYGCDFAMLDRMTERCSVPQVQELAECIPANHRAFIRNLPAAIEEPDLFVVHGKWDPDDLAEQPTISEKLERQPKLRHRLLWGRFTEDELGRTKAWRRTGYFGHTPVSFYGAAVGRSGMMLPVVANRMVLLDTAAALGHDGRLTAFCPDDGAFVQVDHFGRLVAD